MTQTLEILERLVGFDTVSEKSNLALIDYAQDFLATRGFEVHRLLDDTGQKAACCLMGIRMLSLLKGNLGRAIRFA